MSDISDLFSVPKNYDEIINKLAFFNFCILVATLYMLDAGTGVISNTLFSHFSSQEVLNPEQKVLNTAQKVLGDGWAPVMPSIAIAFFCALLFRIIRLHNLISDIFGIRRRFDINRIIIPLAKKVGCANIKDKMTSIEKDRHKIISEIFYKYASFNAPNIDSQLVSNARDYWFWFWLMLETVCVWFLLSAVVFALYLFHSKNKETFISAGRALITMTLMSLPLLYLLWRKCISAAERQIDAILHDRRQKKKIKEHIDALQNKTLRKDNQNQKRKCRPHT